jgi:hypothetical protein
MADTGKQNPFAKYAPSPPAAAQAGAGNPFAKYGGATPDATPAVTPAPAAVPSAAASGPSVAAGNMAKAAAGRSGTYAPGAHKPTFDEFMQGAEAWARGASFGTSDDASAGLAALILKAKGDPRAMHDLYTQLDQAENARIDQYEAQNGKGAEIAGMFTGPGVVRLGKWIGNGANWLYRAGRASLGGAGGAAAADVGYAKPGEKIDPARTGTAAAIGGVAGPVLQGATEVIAPPISAAAARLINQGVRPRVGQLMGGAAKATEEKLESLPLMGDAAKNAQRAAIEQFNRATFNNVLRPLGIEVDPAQAVGREGYQTIRGILDDHYDQILPHLNLTADIPFQMTMAGIDRMAAALPPPQAAQYAQIINNEFASKLTSGPNGTWSMDGHTLKSVESELSRWAGNLRADPSANQKALGDVIQDVISTVRNELTRQNPTYAPQLQAVNEAYARFTRLRDAMSKLGAHDGIFTPAQLLSAVKSQDRSAGKGAFAGGTALMQDLASDANQVIGSKYPDSGTAGRLLLNGGVLSALGGGAHYAPETAVGTAASLGIGSIPYLPGVRNWFSSPYAQGTGALLRQVNPGVASQLPQAQGAQDMMAR